MEQERPIRVVIAEDQRLTRETLARLLAMEPGFEVVGAAQDGLDALNLVRRSRPTVLLTDIEMPCMNGIELTRTVKQEMSDVGVVVLTIYHDDARVFQAIRAGAQGYVLKDCPMEDTLDAIRAVARGEGLLHPSVAARVLTEFARLAGRGASDQAVFSELSAREVEVLRELATGKRNRQIAEALFISEKTVKNHISSILFKLHVNDRTEAALLAARQGLV
jgi:DNA-binding NarL/FixJ family response regulator